MMRYALRRMLVALLVALTVSVIGFALLRLSGDLAHVLAGQSASDAEVRDVARAYGLDRPLWRQYLSWLWALLHGDMGSSLFTHEAVADMIAERVGVTLELALPSLVLALLISIPLGVWAAWRAGGWIDRVIAVVAVVGQGIPTFWLGLVLIQILAVKLRWLPVSGGQSALGFVMPVVTLAVGCVPAFLRLARSGMIDTLGTDYVRMARAKGLSDASVVFKHALRNAMLPLVALSAVQLGFLLGGSVVVESVFALNGVGLLAYQSILRTDFPVVQAILVAIACAYIVLTLVSDLVNARLDPRIDLR